MVPLITLEEHFMSKSIEPSASGKYGQQFKFLPRVAEQLRDLDALRLADMDKGQVTVQVISHAPHNAHLPASQVIAANDELAAAVVAHPQRFAAFAALPMADPAAAAEELVRCVTKLGFCGALIDSHVGGRYYDDKTFWPVFAAAQDLDVPIYIHPTFPTEDMVPRYEGNFSSGAAMSMATSGFGWHYDVGQHVLRLFAAGVFDEYPRVKIIIGHFGEMLPAMVGRIAQLSVRWGARQRPFKEVWDANIWLTTSGVWSVDPMATILRNTSVDKILYSVDYPFADNADGVKFMDELQASGLVSSDEFEKIAYRNAEKLLRIQVAI